MPTRRRTTVPTRRVKASTWKPATHELRMTLDEAMRVAACTLDELIAGDLADADPRLRALERARLNIWRRELLAELRLRLETRLIQNAHHQLPD